MRRVSAALLATLICVLAGSTAAHAKRPVHATLTNPAELQHAAAGERVRVAWTQNGPAQLPVSDDSDVRAPAVYVTLRGAAPGPPLKVPARPAAVDPQRLAAARYVADATVPAGGIASLQITVEGLRSRPGEPPVAANVVPREMLIVNDPFAVSGHDGAGGGAPVPRGAITLWLVALTLLAGGVRAATIGRPAT
jgi:hypothetical protein